MSRLLSQLTWIAWFLAILTTAVPRTSNAETQWPQAFDAELVVDGLAYPTAIALSPDGRIFVAEKSGTVRVIGRKGQLLPAPFVTVAVDTANDRGLVGLTLHPSFPNVPWVYIAYTSPEIPSNPANPISRIHRITRWTADGNESVPGSETFVVDGIPSDSDSHTGGALRFGPDGMLYAGIGDGSPYPFVNPLALRALDVDQLVGKILRVTPGGKVPVDNPFYSTSDANRSKVWQLGLRNPFRASFHPTTGALWIGDVGWRDWEEVDSGPPGANFGWPCFEGLVPQPLYVEAYPKLCDGVIPHAPLYVYGRTPNGAASSGIAWLDGESLPDEWEGKLLIADYSQHWIRALTIAPNGAVLAEEPFATGDDSFRPVDLAVASDGTLYVLEIAADFSLPSGRIWRVSWGGK